MRCVTVRRGDVFVVMGGSGCGKSTLLRHMIGLLEPAAGEVFYGDESFTRATTARRAALLRGVGVLYQTGGLWGSMTLAENVALPLREHTRLPESTIQIMTKIKLDLVGLGGFEQVRRYRFPFGDRLVDRDGQGRSPNSNRAGAERACSLRYDVGITFDDLN